MPTPIGDRCGRPACEGVAIHVGEITSETIDVQRTIDGEIARTIVPGQAGADPMIARRKGLDDQVRRGNLNAIR